MFGDWTGDSPGILIGGWIGCTAAVSLVQLVAIVDDVLCEKQIGGCFLKTFNHV